MIELPYKLKHKKKVDKPKHLQCHTIIAKAFKIVTAANPKSNDKLSENGSEMLRFLLMHGNLLH